MIVEDIRGSGEIAQARFIAKHVHEAERSALPMHGMKGFASRPHN